MRTEGRVKTGTREGGSITAQIRGCKARKRDAGRKRAEGLRSFAANSRVGRGMTRSQVEAPGQRPTGPPLALC